MLLCSEQLNQKWKTCSLQRRQEEGRDRIYNFVSIYTGWFSWNIFRFFFYYCFSSVLLEGLFSYMANYFYLLLLFFLILLVLAGIKLIFLIIFHALLCFRFVTKPVLIIQEFINYCWTLLAQCQDTVCFLFCFFQTVSLRWAKEIL